MTIPVNLHVSLVLSLSVKILRFGLRDKHVFKHGLDLCMGYWSSGMVRICTHSVTDANIFVILGDPPDRDLRELPLTIVIVSKHLQIPPSGIEISSYPARNSA